MPTVDFNHGSLYLNDRCISINDLQWNEHASFKGVFLKHVITGNTTNNQLSCHLVRINPKCEIGLHQHIGKTELHEILSGSGECTIDNKQLTYVSGTVGIIPANKDHLVKAGPDGLLLLAKFFPALL